MNNRVSISLVAAAASYASILSAGAQGGFVHPPDHNLFPPGSSLNPIHVEQVNPPQVVYPPPIYPAPQNVQPREREYVPVYPRQERLAPRAEFEAIRFIPTEPYAYSPSKGDFCYLSGNKTQLPNGTSRIVIGKTKHLATADKNAYASDVSEIKSLARKHHADEFIIHGGRRWSDGEEVLVKFVVWRNSSSESVSPESDEPNPPSQPRSSPSPRTYRVVKVKANDYLSLREGPGSDYKVVNKLPAEIGGIELKERRVANGETVWQEISVSGQTGYVNESYLELER